MSKKIVRGKVKKAARSRGAPVSVTPEASASKAPAHGRPSILKITSEVVEQVHTLASLGLTLPQIAKVLGISDRTLGNYKTQHAGLEEAYQRGRQEGLARVARRLYEHAMSHDRSSLTACIFYLKTQGRWVESPTVLQHQGPDGGAITINTAQDQLAVLLTRLAKQADDGGPGKTAP